MDVKVLLTVLAVLLPKMGVLMCHPTTWRSYNQPIYLPGPQFCPDTGRTVCTAVDYYPTDRIYNLLTSTKSQIFNLTSLFFDERKGDVEPNTSQLPAHPPYYYQNGYGRNQPPPGGRFSPAGHMTSWDQQNGPGNGRAPYSRSMRWRQSSQTNDSGQSNSGSYNVNNGQSNGGSYNANNGQFNDGSYNANNGQSNAGSYNVNNGQPAGRHRIQNQRNTYSWNNASSRDQPQTPKPHRTNNNNNYANNNNNMQHSSYFPQQPISDVHIQPLQNHQWGTTGQPHQSHQDKGYDSRAKSNYQTGQRGSNGLYQIQAPQMLQNNKRGNLKQAPLHDSSWNGPANQQAHSNTYNHPSEDVNHHNGVKRGKRNQDVEVACPVQSTYVPPRAALSDQSEWKYIINVPERDQRFSQVVRVDVCLTEGQPCSSRLSLPFGFESRCRQKYIKKKLLSLNPDGQGTAEDNFFIPSCCVCEIVRSNQK